MARVSLMCMAFMIALGLLGMQRIQGQSGLAFGERAGNPDKTTIFPANLMVDYVRVYRKN